MNFIFNIKKANEELSVLRLAVQDKQDQFDKMAVSILEKDKQIEGYEKEILTLNEKIIALTNDLTMKEKVEAEKLDEAIELTASQGVYLADLPKDNDVPSRNLMEQYDNIKDPVEKSKFLKTNWTKLINGIQ